MLLVGAGLFDSETSGAACRDLSTNPPSPTALVRHLSAECSPQEREARAIPAAEVLKALQAGQPVDLDGVVVTGDLFLDTLPSIPVDRIPSLAESTRSLLRDMSVSEVRVIRSLFSIRESVVRGTLATRIKTGAILFQGPVVMAATVCEGVQDWSRIVLMEGGDWSATRFMGEALFVQSRLQGPVRFLGTQFGPHTRFHLARFFGPVVFDDAVFHGLAELLEVSYGDRASFARTVFRQGTGFSGDVFAEDVDFGAAHFEREAYFLFAQFRGSARFVETEFAGAVAFDQAQFERRTDFSRAKFAKAPEWSHVQFRGERIVPGRPATAASTLALTAGLGVVCLGLLWWLLRGG